MVQNALQNYKTIKSDPEVSASKSWSDVARNYKNNFIPDAQEELNNIIQAAQYAYNDPVGTAKAIGGHMYDMGVGLGSKTLDALPVGYNPTGDVKYHREEALDNVINDLKEKYGSVEGFKNYLSEHPAQATAELATIALGGTRLLKGGVDFLNSPDFVRLLEDESGAVTLPGAPRVPAPERKPGDVRVSTRLPSGPNAIENPYTHQLSTGLDETLRSPSFDKNKDLLAEYPGFAFLKGMGREDAAEAFVNRGRDNLVWLFKNSPEIMQERSPRWYEGANRIAESLAQRYGVPKQAVAGAMAALSPQLDWYTNASQAERIGDFIFGPKSSMRMTPEMASYAKTIDTLKTNPVNKEATKNIMGKRFSDLTNPTEQAIWLRLYDEMHNPTSFRSITPEGEYGDFIRNNNGDPRKMFWLNFGNIGKAIQSYQSGGDMDVISPLLGDMHKVRNFYNNIVDPYDRIFGDVTADTHQVAATHLRPLSGKSAAVSHNFGVGLAPKDQPFGYVAPSKSTIDGVKGLYGLYTEATRRAAADLGMLPRAAQSSTWEPIRELFTETWKGNKANVERVDNIWRDYDKGYLTLNEARNQIFDLAGGVGAPEWSKSGIKVYDPEKHSSYR